MTTDSGKTNLLEFKRPEVQLLVLFDFLKENIHAVFCMYDSVYSYCLLFLYWRSSYSLPRCAQGSTCTHQG